MGQTSTARVLGAGAGRLSLISALAAGGWLGLPVLAAVRPAVKADAPDRATAAPAVRPGTRLLLDHRVIAGTENAQLVLGAVRRHPANPLFGEDRPWEKRFDNLYANVLYDADAGQYRCWYSPFTVDHSAKGMALEQRQSTRYSPPRNREMGVCYAVSRDGLKWEKPELNLVEFAGGTANTLVLRGPHGAGICVDPGERDPQRRYRMFHARDVLRFSGDGLHWSEPVPCPGIESRGDTHNNLLLVPERGQYAGFVRLREGTQRIVGRAESKDLLRWTKAVEVLRGDAENQAYSMPVFRYAGIYLGLVAILRTREDRVHTELAWSPDTVTWQRIQPGVPLLGNSPNEGDYDWGCVYAAAAPVVHPGEIRLYYGGSNGRHTGWREGFLCLAILRPDGWAGYEPIDATHPAIVLTKPFAPDGGTLCLTADIAPGGSVRAAVVDGAGAIVVTSRPITISGTDATVGWPSRPAFGSSPIALRFELTKAKLYSYRFVP